MKRAAAAVAMLGAVLVNGCTREEERLKPEEVRLVEVATSERRWTGIAVSRQGRLFVNYPLWEASFQSRGCATRQLSQRCPR